MLHHSITIFINLLLYIATHKLQEETETQNMNGVGENAGITGSKAFLLQCR